MINENEQIKLIYWFCFIKSTFLMQFELNSKLM